MLMKMPESNELNKLQLVAKNAQQSGLYQSVGGEAKIFMILLAARELNIPPMQALNGGIWNIQGKIEISARLMNSMIRRAGHSITIEESNNKVCRLKGKRSDNGDCFYSQFTIEDAQNAGLANKDVWKKYTEDMLYNRAMSRLARRLFPDVIGNAYVEGEIREAIAEENATVEPVIDSEAIEVKVETSEEIDEVYSHFSKDYSQESPDLIKKYLRVYAKYHKKSALETVQDYQDSEKFSADYMIWRNKYYPNA